MKRLFWAIAALLPLAVACTDADDSPVILRAFRALPEDVFESISSSLGPSAAREALIKDLIYQEGGNEDTRHFSLNYDADYPDEMNVYCSQDPVFNFVQLHLYKMAAKDDWFVLFDVGENIDELPMKSLITKGFRFNAKKGSLQEADIPVASYTNDEFFEPVLSWPYIKGGEDVKSVHVLMMDFGYYVCPNQADELSDLSMNPIPFSLKYVWNGESFVKDGYGPALGFIDNLAAFNVLSQPFIPTNFDLEFPGCTVETSCEEGYNNVPLWHFDIYQGGEHLIRLDPFPSMTDDEGRYVLMQVASFSSRYKTVEGFGVGSLLSDIKNSKVIYGMNMEDFELEDTTTDDNRPAVAVHFDGYDAETLFVTDAQTVDSPDARVIEVLIRPIAKG